MPRSDAPRALDAYEINDERVESLTVQAETDARECRIRARRHAYACRAAVLAGDHATATQHARASQAYSELLDDWITRGESLLRVAEAAAAGEEVTR